MNTTQEDIIQMKYTSYNAQETEQINLRPKRPTDGEFIQNVIDSHSLNAYTFSVEAEEGYKICGDVNLEISNL